MEYEDRDRQRDVQQEEQEEEMMEQIDESMTPHCCNCTNLAFLVKFYKNYIEKKSNNIVRIWPTIGTSIIENENSDEEWFENGPSGVDVSNQKRTKYIKRKRPNFTIDSAGGELACLSAEARRTLREKGYDFEKIKVKNTKYFRCDYSLIKNEKS
ncbi:unnamed protein product [Brachionus calyciflorus]|uniref:Uncharacterized protein n=1 Tax=Brachionus calyciflorus TaxID=104777 RepID=A0A814KFS2_9BILA|nr:unnamed protein product [Brachionus calyciflorus]